MRIRPFNPLRRTVTVVAAGMLMIGSATGCGSDGSGAASADAAVAATQKRLEGNPALAALVKAAEKEGALNLNWGLHGREAATTLIDTFKKAYGLDIKVTHTPDQNMPGNTAKLIQEYEAGSAASTDVLLSNPENAVNVGPKRAGAVQRVDWQAFAPWTKGLVSKDGYAMTVLDQITGFTYNTGLVKKDELPTSARDVLSFGKPVASTPYAAQFNVLGSADAMGPAGVRAYLKTFQPAGFLGCGELGRVASGEFAALWISCGKNLADVYAEEKGAPLETAVIKDAATTSPWYMTVPKKARHPSAAKLWASWLVTPEAQKLLFEHERADNRRIPGSRTARQIADYEAKGVKFTDVSYEFAVAHPDLYNPKFKGELIKLLTAK